MQRKDSLVPTFVRSARTRAALATIICLFGFGMFAAAPAYAQAPVTNGLQAVGEAGGLAGGETDLITIIGRIINIVLGLVGVILLVLLLYAGYLWMTSGGDATKVDQAKRIIRNAIIGLIIVVSAFAITRFILEQLTGAIGGGGGVRGGGPGAGSGFPGAAGSLGGGIIESHVPFRDATGVPRNTAIIITFKEPIRISSFIAGYDDNGTPADLTDDATSSTTIGLNSDAVKIYRTGSRDAALTTAQARVRFTADRQTFVIRPVDLLGSATADTPYTVELLPGSSGIVREDGRPAFGGAFGSGYQWSFDVSTEVDTTQPRVTSVIPSDGGTFAPNIIVQINFNEPIDPTSAAGLIIGGSGFTNIEVTAQPTAGGAITRPNGEFKMSNQYRTVEFVSDLSCGTNSCGRTVYCLPSLSTIQVIAHSATMDPEAPPLAQFTASGVDGVTDIAGNVLNGDGDEVPEGRPGDDYGWTFATLDEPNLDAPRISSTLPPAGDFSAHPVGSSNIPLDQAPQATFDSVLQSSTVNTDNVRIRTNEVAELADTFWWTTRQDVLNSSGAVAAPGDDTVAGRVTINHRVYAPATTGTPPMYQPFLDSGLQNVYQNCFNPASSGSCTGSPYCCDNRPSTVACSPPSP